MAISTPLYAVIDVGCIECGESSGLVGVFTDKKIADMVADDCIKIQRLNWRGEHMFYVWKIGSVDSIGYIPDYVRKCLGDPIYSRRYDEDDE